MSSFRIGLCIPFLFLTVLLPLGCSAPAKIIRETSTPMRPKWIDAVPQQPDALYFVGIRSGAETLEQGLDSAVKNASARIAGFLKSKIKSDFEEHSTEVEQSLRQQISSKSQASVSGAKVADWYYEKIKRVDNKFSIERYDVYVLISYPRAEVEKENARQEKERIEAAQSAYELYVRGRDQEKRRLLAGAKRSYRQALEALKTVDEVVHFEGRYSRDSTDLQNLLNARLDEVAGQMRKVLLSVRVSGPKDANRTFRSSLAASLAQHGFTVTEKEPAFELSGDVSVKESSFVMNNYVYYAAGSVSARRVNDRQVVAVAPFKVKGFHRIQEQSALDALQEAGKEAGQTLAKMILEKENAQ
jgi:hypothetical protein